VREHNEVFGGKVWVEEKMTALVLHYRELEESNIASRKQGLKISKLPISTSVTKFKSKLIRGEIGCLVTVELFFAKMQKLKETGQLPDDKLIVENDNCAVEVRMGELFSKGQIAQQVLKDKDDIEMVLCFGDSGSDESMMNTLFKMKENWPKFPPMLTTVHVDNGKWLQKGFKTNAQQVAEDPQEVTNLFRAFYNLPPKDVNLNFEKILADANSKHAQKLAEANQKLAQRLADSRLNDGQLLSRITNNLKFYLSSLKFVSYLNPK
jgi:trehalose-6-phosphatase